MTYNNLLIIFGGRRKIIQEKNDVHVYSTISKSWVMIEKDKMMDKTVLYTAKVGVEDQSPERVAHGMDRSTLTTPFTPTLPNKEGQSKKLKRYHRRGQSTSHRKKRPRPTNTPGNPRLTQTSQASR